MYVAYLCMHMNICKQTLSNVIKKRLKTIRCKTHQSYMQSTKEALNRKILAQQPHTNLSSSN